MRYAFVEDDCHEAAPGLAGTCRVCGGAAIAKCGQHRIWHWAHKGTRTCDTWWEPETQWHRGWKDHFPKGWQETIHAAPNGEKHIADVKTESGVALEFQHSFLPEAERQGREQFYSKMIWIVDGQRRKRDRAQFFASFDNAIHQQPLVIPARLHDSALLRDWKASRVPVYFDFGDSEPSDLCRFSEPTLWRLNPNSQSGAVFLSPVAKSYLIEVYRTGVAFDEPFTETLQLVADLLRKRQEFRHRMPSAFDWQLMRRQRARRRF
ncbi:competence protein CoiA [Bradyrhizobium japonicum]|uniref:competence protein CoiA n=1 Tax=Bradyrhizobium japonicum TaxID=375 RepID=UPI001B8A7081|nr:competence protein CoiA family protein [Bradyrhizobium japonicum]MBR0969681.1 competence protein [Bradyrhizobium japonicum]